MGWPGPMTHRQYLSWQAWLSEEWNYPSRSDNYLMAIRADIHRFGAKDQHKIHPKDFKLEFDLKQQKVLTEEEKEQHKKRVADMSQKVWVHRVGGKVHKQTKEKDG